MTNTNTKTRTKARTRTRTRTTLLSSHLALLQLGEKDPILQDELAGLHGGGGLLHLPLGVPPQLAQLDAAPKLCAPQLAELRLLLPLLPGQARHRLPGQGLVGLGVPGS